MQDYTGG